MLHFYHPMVTCQLQMENQLSYPRSLVILILTHKNIRYRNSNGLNLSNMVMKGGEEQKLIPLLTRPMKTLLQNFCEFSHELFGLFNVR